MQVPLELSVREIDHTAELDALIERKVAHLERFCGSIASCRIAIERRHIREHSPGPYHVRIDLTIPPGHELVVDRDPTTPAANDLRTVIHHAFKAAERRVKGLVERRRGDVKHIEEPRALVERVFPRKGYGFLRTLDGQQIYFHKNSVAGGDFDRVAVGTEVRYASTSGREGEQATTVQIVNKPGARAPNGRVKE